MLSNFAFSCFFYFLSCSRCYPCSTVFFFSYIPRFWLLPPHILDHIPLGVNWGIILCRIRQCLKAIPNLEHKLLFCAWTLESGGVELFPFLILFLHLAKFQLHCHQVVVTENISPPESSNIGK